MKTFITVALLLLAVPASAKLICTNTWEVGTLGGAFIVEFPPNPPATTGTYFVFIDPGEGSDIQACFDDPSVCTTIKCALSDCSTQEIPACYLYLRSHCVDPACTDPSCEREPTVRLILSASPELCE